jgi:hypothetical protein
MSELSSPPIILAVLDVPHHRPHLGPGLVGYMTITEGSSAKLRCPVGYLDITEGSRAKMGSTVGYINIPELFHLPPRSFLYSQGPRIYLVIKVCQDHTITL